MKQAVQPYAGITGLTSVGQVEAVATQFEEAGFGPDKSHIGMVGFLASRGTLWEEPMSWRHPPTLQKLVELTGAVRGRMLPMIHYEAAAEPRFAPPLGEIFRELYGPGLCRAAQINARPAPDEVQRLLDSYPELDLVYQIRPELMAQGADAIVRELALHRGAFKYILIDPSCGRGQEFDPAQALPVYQALRAAFPEALLGFAGGFSAENVEARTAGLVTATGRRDFLIDAEGKVRTPGDDLDLKKTGGYIAGAARGYGLQA